MKNKLAMDYMEQQAEQFNSFIETCIEKKQYVGLGNPMAKILIIGKEEGKSTNSQNKDGYGESWKNHDFSKRYSPDEKDNNINLKNNNHTWQKYQKLYEIIIEKLNLVKRLKKKNDIYEITFVENVFTTELSNYPAPNSGEAKKKKYFKQKLNERKEIVFKNDFIRQFPIVIITASDNNYIETYSGEVQELFDVKFIEEIKVRSSKIWVHYSEESENSNFSKTVLHTRQLTNGASNELLEKLADLVTEFVKKHNINVLVKEI